MDIYLQAWTAGVLPSAIPKRHRWDDFKDPIYCFLADFVQFYWKHLADWINHFGKNKERRLSFDRVTDIRFLTYDKAAFVVYSNYSRVVEFLEVMNATELLKFLGQKYFRSKLWLLATLYLKLILPYLFLLLHFPSNITFNSILLSYLPRVQYYSLHPHLFFTATRGPLDIFSLSERWTPKMCSVEVDDILSNYQPLEDPPEFPPTSVLTDSLQLYYSKLYKHTQHLGKKKIYCLTNRCWRMS